MALMHRLHLVDLGRREPVLAWVRWDVIGTDPKSGQQIKLTVEARDVDEAKYLAAEKGMLVEGVRRANA